MAQCEAIINGERCTNEDWSRKMCQACYYRDRRNGTVQRKNMIRSAHCTHIDEDGTKCTEPVLARNFCIKHYRKTKHELNAMWKLLRSRHKGEYPAAWDRFNDFLADVGERPGPHHKLKRHDETQPFSKENCFWKPPVGKNRSGMSKDEQSSYGREWNLRERFGIDSLDYDRMMVEQGGKCAICRLPETSLHHKTGLPKSLAVDHDHDTKAVRGLLCANCNTAIGLFDDSPDILRVAAAYLERYAKLEISNEER